MADITVSLRSTADTPGTITSSFLGAGGAWVGGGMPKETVLGANAMIQDTLRLSDTCDLNLQITFGAGTSDAPFRIVSADMNAERVPVMSLPDNFGRDDYDPDVDGVPTETGEWFDVKVKGAGAAGLPIAAEWAEDEKAVTFKIGP